LDGKLVFVGTDQSHFNALNTESNIKGSCTVKKSFAAGYEVETRSEDEDTSSWAQVPKKDKKEATKEPEKQKEKALKDYNQL